MCHVPCAQFQPRCHAATGLLAAAEGMSMLGSRNDPASELHIQYSTVHYTTAVRGFRGVSETVEPGKLPDRTAPPYSGRLL
jgi:hypothetical protein